MIEIDSPERAKRIALELSQRETRAKAYAEVMGTEVSTDLEPKAQGPKGQVAANQRWREKNKQAYNTGQAALMRRRREKTKQQTP